MLNRYAETFGVKPGWLFLTGTKEDVERVRRNLGFAYADRVRDRTQHLGMVKYGIEPLERWAGCPALTNPKWIVRYLSWLDPKGERPSGWPGEATSPSIPK